jgi:hypothetical protein
VLVRETARGRRLLLAARQRRLEALAARLAQLSPDELAVVGEASALIERVLAGAASDGAADASAADVRRPAQPTRLRRSK